MAYALPQAIVDTDILIALAKGECYNLLQDWPSFRFDTTEVNLREMKLPEQRQLLENAIREKLLGVLELDTIEAIGMFGDFRIRADPGESAVIVAAFLRSAAAVSHDRAAKRLARLTAPPVPIASLEDIVVESFRLTRISYDGIQEFAAKLAAKKDYALFSRGLPSPAEITAWSCPWTLSSPPAS